MTPAYASPEQIRGEPITTSSDIYSLGVVLYELVTGIRPFDHDSVTFERMFQFVTLSEPERPSLKSSGRLSPRYRQSLKGDIDNIVLMAMRKEPERRYRSVDQFADDVERHLNGLPIAATEDTFVYRTTKFVKRHWIGVASAALTAAVLVGGMVTTAWQARKARQEQALAEETKTFLKRTLNYSNPLWTGKDIKETTVTEVLDEAAKRLESGEFAAQPETRAELELIIGKAYNGQGRNRLASEHIEKYVDIERALYGDDHPKTLVALSERASLQFYRGDMQPADAAFTRILPLMRTEQVNGNVTPASLASALNTYACLRRTMGDSKQAESLFREALDVGQQLSADEWRLINGTTRSTLASTLSDQGRYEEALHESREAVDEFTRRGETGEPNFGFTLTVLGGFLTESGNYDEAETSLREGETIIRKFLSPASLWIGDNLRNQAILSYERGKYSDALTKTDQALSIYEETFGTHYDQYPTALITKGLSLAKMGRAKEGEAVLRQAVEIRTQLLPSDHYWVALANSALGECLVIEARYAEAEPLLTQSLENLKISQGEQNPRTEIARRRLSLLYQSWHKPDPTNRYVASISH